MFSISYLLNLIRSAIALIRTYWSILDLSLTNGNKNASTHENTKTKAVKQAKKAKAKIKSGEIERYNKQITNEK